LVAVWLSRNEHLGKGKSMFDFLEKAARRAGDESLKFYRKTFAQEEKSDHRGIVTEADLACEKIIKDMISSEFPDHLILAEESGLQGENEGMQGERAELVKAMWFVDPIDGTNNFSRGNPYYCISIAFGDSAGGIQAGCVFQPTTNRMFLAERGKGAFCNGERLKLRHIDDFSKGSFVTGFGPAHGPALREVVESIYRVQSNCTSTAVRINGAAALDLANVGWGIFNGFWERNLNPWDLAAGVLIVEEAGGRAVNYEGEPFNLLRDRDVVAANGELIDRLLSLATTSH
jgi:myo-inositol-1(or 4)-monophosphatase